MGMRRSGKRTKRVYKTMKMTGIANQGDRCEDEGNGEKDEYEEQGRMREIADGKGYSYGKGMMALELSMILTGKRHEGT